MAAELALVREIVKLYPKMLVAEKSYPRLSRGKSEGGHSDPTATAALRSTGNLLPEQERNLQALRRSISHTHLQYANGLQRLTIVDLVYWKQTHSVAEAAEATDCSPCDAQMYLKDFLRSVEEFLELNHCKGCIYWRPLLGKAKACHFCFDNDALRQQEGAQCFSKSNDPDRLKEAGWYRRARAPR